MASQNGVNQEVHLTTIEKRKPGRKTLSEKTGEETYSLKILIPKSQYDFLMSRKWTASAYVRYLLEIAMQADKLESDDPSTASLEEVLAEAREVQAKLNALLEDE